MTVSRSKYLDGLKSRVSEEERHGLEYGGISHISDFNRETILRMLNDAGDSTGAVDAECAEGLESALGSYLETYMADRPDWHKWIILSCLYLSQIVREPLHPQQVAGWRREGGVCYCNAREDVPGSICKWCVCRSADMEVDDNE